MPILHTYFLSRHGDEQWYVMPDILKSLEFLLHFLQFNNVTDACCVDFNFATLAKATPLRFCVISMFIKYVAFEFKISWEWYQ